MRYLFAMTTLTNVHVIDESIGQRQQRLRICRQLFEHIQRYSDRPTYLFFKAMFSSQINNYTYLIDSDNVKGQRGLFLMTW